MLVFSGINVFSEFVGCFPELFFNRPLQCCFSFWLLPLISPDYSNSYLTDNEVFVYFLCYFLTVREVLRFSAVKQPTQGA